MATPFPCPNPVCSYRFDPAILPPAAMVTCPLCQTRFPYRASAMPAAAPPQAVPGGYPQAPGWGTQAPTAPAPGYGPSAFDPTVTAFPAQAPSYPAAPPAVPYPAPGFPAPPPAEAPRPVSPRLVSSRYAPQTGKRSTYIVLGLFTAFVIVALFIIYNITQKSPWERPRAAGPQVFEDYNFSYSVPDRWLNDPDARAGLQVNTFALRRADNAAFVAMYAQDFRERNPRPAELRALTLEKLRRYFDNLELEDKGVATWAKQDATHTAFAADQEGALVRGEVHSMSYQGIGYIFFAWAPADRHGEAAGDFKAMRDRFGLLDKRDRWAEQKSATTVFSVRDGNYEVQDADGVWKARLPNDEDLDPKRHDKFAVDPKEIDPQATIALRAVYPVKNARAKGIDFVPEAHGLVLVLDRPAGDPVAAIKARILARYKKDDPDADVSFSEIKSPSDTPLPDAAAKLARFQATSKRDADLRWYYVVAALPVGDKLVAVETKCRNTGRVSGAFAQHMEPYMIKLAASLRAK